MKVGWAMNLKKTNRAWLLLTLVVVVCWTSVVQADRPGWQRQEVNWRITGGGSIKAIHYPEEKPPLLLTRQDGRRPGAPYKKILADKSARQDKTFTAESAAPVLATVIESPPIAGFVPWVAIAVTDERLEELEINAEPNPWVIGNYLTSTPETDYGIGIFDTGAGAHIIGNADAVRAGLFDYYPSFITSSMVDLQGVIGTVSAWVSQPIGIFVDGLGAIELNGLILDDSYMVGESNVSICVGDQLESPNLPTVIGTPLSVFYTTVIYNDRQVTITRDGNEFTGPDIRIYESYDPCIPDFDNVIPLELRPAGAVAVQYFPNVFDPEDPEWGAPMSPSVISSFLPTQSLFFASSVDLTEGTRSAIDKDGFMFDTGAQVSVISEAIAARLSLNLNNPEFEVEIRDVTGEVAIKPGFYIDSLEITATPDWLSFTNVPVVVLDVASPEGGTLDGIIGMNLFTEFNLVLRSGGLPDYGGHRLEFQPLTLTSCFPSTYSTYEGWLNIGKPSCWCPKLRGNGYQCDGDADNLTQGILKYRIYTNDFNILVANWKMLINDPALNPCADFDHKPQGVLKFRVYTNDFNILVGNWKKTDAELPGDCPRPE
jgi:hypothetical protein